MEHAMHAWSSWQVHRSLAKLFFILWVVVGCVLLSSPLTPREFAPRFMLFVSLPVLPVTSSAASGEFAAAALFLALPALVACCWVVAARRSATVAPRVVARAAIASYWFVLLCGLGAGL